MPPRLEWTISYASRGAAVHTIKIWLDAATVSRRANSHPYGLEIVLPEGTTFLNFSTLCSTYNVTLPDNWGRVPKGYWVFVPTLIQTLQAAGIAWHPNRPVELHVTVTQLNAWQQSPLTLDLSNLHIKPPVDGTITVAFPVSGRWNLFWYKLLRPTLRRPLKPSPSRYPEKDPRDNPTVNEKELHVDFPLSSTRNQKFTTLKVEFPSSWLYGLLVRKGVFGSILALLVLVSIAFWRIAPIVNFLRDFFGRAGPGKP